MDGLIQHPKLLKADVQNFEPLAVDDESSDEIDASKDQVLWSNIMDKGNYMKSPGYNKVAVLLLCWEQTSGDFSTEEEVKKLEAAFVDKFGYKTIVEKLNAYNQGRLQVQVNAKVANFVEAYDAPNALLIVYYAGHGKPGKYFGDLEIFGQTSPNDRRDAKRKRDGIVWNKTEDLLKPAAADILEIFDCCYAGTLGLTRGEDRLFEYLAAAKDQGKTPVPGEQSFTSALIFALEDLVQQKKEGRFTTLELLRKIKHHAPNFPKDQHPVLSERGDPHRPAGRIMLHPLRRHETMAEVPNEGFEMDSKKHTVTLHFDFGGKPSKDHLETLGAGLNGIFDRNTLEVHRVRWGGMRASMVARAVRRFQAPVRRRRASQREERASVGKLLTPGLSSSPSSCLLSPPATEYQTPDSSGTNTAEVATSSRSGWGDSSAESDSLRRGRRKRRRLAETSGTAS